VSDFRQVLLGIFAALFSSALVFGSLALALTEGGYSLALAPGPTQTLGPTPTVNTPRPGEPTFTPSPSPVPSATPTPISSVCPVPPGWQTIDFLPGDTLAGIASQYGISLETLKANNCLKSDYLNGGVVLNVPALPASPTPTYTPPPPTATRPAPTRVSLVCRRPAGWTIYIVRSGDYLYRIGLAYGVTVNQLMVANCLNSITIITGQRLYVPNVPTRTPVMTPTLAPSATAGAPTPTTGVSSPTPRPSATQTTPPNTNPTATNTPVTPPASPTSTNPPPPTNTSAPPTPTPYPTPVIQPTTTQPFEP